MSRWQAFNPSDEPDTCLWCGRKLRLDKYNKPGSKLGPYADGFFDTMRYAYQFACALAEKGRRLVKS